MGKKDKAENKNAKKLNEKKPKTGQKRFSQKGLFVTATIWEFSCRASKSGGTSAKIRLKLASQVAKWPIDDERHRWELVWQS